MSATLQIAGDALALLPERAAWWEAAETLLVADVHLGKAATFRAAAVPVSDESSAADLRRLSVVLERTNVRRLVVLGDLVHARAGLSPAVVEAVTRWRETHAAVEMLLVRGNHDDAAGVVPASWGFDECDGPLVEPPFVLRHTPEADERGYVLAGHLHPNVRLRGPGRETLVLPCFLAEPAFLVLPAFAAFTGSVCVRPGRAARVFVPADGEVIEVTGAC